MMSHLAEAYGASGGVNCEVLSPVSFLYRSAEAYPHKTAIVYKDKRITYLTFLERVNRLANVLKSMGINKGDKVAFICANTPEMIEAHYAVPLIGAVLVSVNIRLSSQEIFYILDHSDAKAVFVDNEFSDLVLPNMQALNKISHFVNVCDVSSACPLPDGEYENLLANASSEKVEASIDDEYQPCTMNYTSGTTGSPKGVLYHHRGAYLNAIGEMLETGFNAQSTYLWTLPLFHCNGWCFSWGVTAMGGTHVCLRKVEAEEVFRLIDAENVSHFCAAPTVLIGLVSYASENNIERLSHPVTICAAGAPPAPKIIETIEAMGIHLIHVYGLTEVFGPHSICAEQDEWKLLSGPERAIKKSRQGIAYVISNFMDVVDPKTMIPVERNGESVGEIVMRGNNVMLGYYKNEAATQEAFEGGWFHSGDLAVVHSDSYVQILDRKKDIIISGGENISTVEIENTLYQHPDVLEVAVIPVPDKKWGEVPKAFVTLKPKSETTEEAIIEFCKANLARFKSPKTIKFGDLPKTATGKIQKFKLREQEWRGMERRVN